MTINRARSFRRFALWIAAVWVGCLVVVSASPAIGQQAGKQVAELGVQGAAFPAATPESQGVSTAAVRRLADEVEAYVKDGTIVGGELLIVKNRRTILHEVYGDLDREIERAMERDTIFNVRSMTKPLTGVAVQMLVDEGKLRLDDPVAKYLPAFDNDTSRAITIEQLLQHRSGLPLMIPMLSPYQYPDLQSQVKVIGEMGPQFQPAEKFWYSDAGSDAAAAIVEQISGTTIDLFVTERILLPLGMADSFYISQADDPRKARVASLYTGTPGKWTRLWKLDGKPFYPFAWGSQTLYSTAADYARFLTLWMDGGMIDGKRLLSDEAIARILTTVSPMTSLGSDKPYPCGFFGLKPYYGQMSVLYAPGESPAQSEVKAFGHSGSDGTAAWAFPAEDLIVCYFTQSRGQWSMMRLETTIQDALLMGVETGETPDEMKPLIGTYSASFGTFKNTPFRVAFRCGKLALDIPGDLVYELKAPDTEGRWRFALNEAAGISFKKGDDGNVQAMILHRAGASFEVPRKVLADE